MYINWILKSRNLRNSNLVRKNRKNNNFLSPTKWEVIRYYVPAWEQGLNLVGRMNKIGVHLKMVYGIWFRYTLSATFEEVSNVKATTKMMISYWNWTFIPFYHFIVSFGFTRWSFFRWGSRDVSMGNLATRKLWITYAKKWMSWSPWFLLGKGLVDTWHWEQWEWKQNHQWESPSWELFKW